METLLIVDDDELIQDALSVHFSERYEVVGALTVEDVKSVLLQRPPPDVALVDLGLAPNPHSPVGGFEAIGVLRAAAPDCVIIVVSGQDVLSHAQRARSLGAHDYVEKPCAPEILEAKIKQARLALSGSRKNLGIIGESAPIVALREQIRLVAPLSCPVLIEGESGAGKELVARALHDMNRGDRPFFAVNCATLPEHLVEATLFGHAKGAFTGAAVAGGGYLGDVADGTLLLDEIGDLPAETQPKLLRLLESGEYRRVGETSVRQSSARIVAASNRRQDRMIEGGGGRGYLRDDLYYRLSVFTIVCPPLRILGDDKVLLLEHYRDAICSDLRGAPFEFDAAAADMWRRYHYPGNVRELKNIIARLQVKYGGQKIGAEDLKGELCAEEATAPPPASTDSGLVREAKEAALQLGHRYLRETMRQCQGDIVAVAKRLDIDRSILEQIHRNSPDYS